MKAIEKWGVDVEAAVGEALKDLKVGRDDVEVEVLEESSNGFLGIGSKLARVKVTLKDGVNAGDTKEKASFDNIDKILADLPENRDVKADDEMRKDYDKYEQEELEDAMAAERLRAKTSSGSNKNSGNGRRKNDRRGGKNKNNAKLDDADLNIESTLLFNIEDLTEVAEHPVKTFLQDIAREMGIDLEYQVKTGEGVVFVEITGKDTGTIIGKRGQTLDAVQYLAGLVANKDGEKHIRVILDAENYRAKRERTLINLANRLAGKVERTRRSVTLEPMNPYERKVIHSALQGNSKVKTRSEGTDPYRRIVIERNRD